MSTPILPVGAKLSLRWPKIDKDVEEAKLWTAYAEKDSDHGNYVWVDATIICANPAAKLRYVLKFSKVQKDVGAATLADCERASNLNDVAFVCHDFIPSFWTPTDQLIDNETWGEVEKECQDLEREYPLHTFLLKKGEFGLRTRVADSDGNLLDGVDIKDKQKKKFEKNII